MIHSFKISYIQFLKHFFIFSLLIKNIMCDDCGSSNNNYAFLCNYPGSVNTCSGSHNLGPGGQHHLGPGGQHHLGPGGQHQQPHSVRLMRQEGQSCGVEQGSCMPGLQCVGNQMGGGVCMAPLGPGGRHHLGVVEGYHGKINLYVMNGCGWCKKLKQRS